MRFRSRLPIIHALAVSPLFSMNTTLHCSRLCGMHNIYIVILIFLAIILYCSILILIGGVLMAVFSDSDILTILRDQNPWWSSGAIPFPLEKPYHRGEYCENIVYRKLRTTS